MYSRGRALEAAAIHHLARAKDETTMLTVMLDVTGFIAFAKRMAEKRQQSHQFEKQYGPELQR